VAELVDALDLGSSAARHGGSSPFIRTTFWFYSSMAHILLLSSQQHGKFSDAMLTATIEVLCAGGHSFDKILLPSAHHFPLALGKFSEEGTYDATICIAAMWENPIAKTDLHYGAIINALYDHAAYFQHCVGISMLLANNKTKVQDAVDYATETTANTCAMLATDKMFYGIEERAYVGGSFQHN
jgi:6,7-dimethyl-8-ribityllumazine synthase